MLKTVLYFLLVTLPMALVFVAVFYKVKEILLAFLIIAVVAFLVVSWKFAKSLADK
jgi:hypothetical protein